MKKVLKAVWRGIKEFLIPIILFLMGCVLIFCWLPALYVGIMLLLNPGVFIINPVGIAVAFVIGIAITYFIVRHIQAQDYAKEMECTFREGWLMTEPDDM